MWHSSVLFVPIQLLQVCTTNKMHVPQMKRVRSESRNRIIES